MRISDWSSDVCSSDLTAAPEGISGSDQQEGEKQGYAHGSRLPCRSLPVNRSGGGCQRNAVALGDLWTFVEIIARGLAPDRDEFAVDAHDGAADIDQGQLRLHEAADRGMAFGRRHAYGVAARRDDARH